MAAQASSAGCIEVLRALKDEVSRERLVDLEARDHRRRTALHVAVAEGRAGTDEEAKKTMGNLSHIVVCLKVIPVMGSTSVVQYAVLLKMPTGKS